MRPPHRDRVLIVTRNFPPLMGGAERLLWNVFDQLSGDYEIDIVGPCGCEAFVRSPHRAIPCRLRPTLWFLFSAFAKVCILAVRRRYVLLIAGSGLTSPITTVVARILGTRSITFVHGLDLLASRYAYRSIAAAAIRRSDRTIANSRHTAGLARSLDVPQERIEILHPGVDLPATQVSPAELLRHQRLKGHEKILLFVGRLVPRKGLREFMERCLPLIASRHSDVLLLVIGESPTMALSSSQESLDELRKLARRLKLERHVRFLGRVSEETLHAAYELSRLLILPIREFDEDTEGFGMVAVEAAAHGTPTIAFRVGGVPDAVSEGRSGILVEPGDDSALVHAVCSALQDASSLPHPESCRRFAAAFSWTKFGDTLREICNGVRRD